MSPRVPVRLAAITAAGLALRLWDIALPSLWFDEALEVERALAVDVATLLAGRPIDQDPPGFALLLRAWTAFESSEWWLRAPAALAGAAAVYLTGAWAARRFGRRVGLLSAVFMALAPVHVHYGQEVNQYALLPAFAAAALVTWDGVLSRGRARDWVRHGAVTAAALATHYGLLFPLAAIGLHLVWVRGVHGTRRDSAAVAAYAAASAVVVAALLGLGLRSRLALPHLDARIGGTHVVKELDYLLDTFWREGVVFLTVPFGGGPLLALAAALGLVALAGAVALWRAGGAGRRVIAVAGVGTLALTYPADIAGAYPLGFRWLLHLGPIAALALAAGVDAVWRTAPALGKLAAGGMLAAAVLCLPQLDAANPWLAVPREAMRPAAVELRASAPDATVVVMPGAAPAFRYYGLRDSVERGEAPSTAANVIWAGGDPGSALPPSSTLSPSSDLPPRSSPSSTSIRAPSAAEAPRGANAPEDVWWVVGRGDEMSAADLVAVWEAEGWTVAERRDRPGVALIRLRCRDCPPARR